METVQGENDKYVIRFDRGEEVMQALVLFATKQNIHGAAFSALGACESVELSFYNLKTKEYQKKNFIENLEVLSVIGNIAWLQEKAVVHAHGTLSRQDFSCIGGHITSLTAAGTIEVHLNAFKQKLKRKFHEDTGLNLLR